MHFEHKKTLDNKNVYSLSSTLKKQKERCLMSTQYYNIKQLF